jgi:hypothetical protein
MKFFFIFSVVVEDSNSVTVDELVEKGENILRAKHGAGHL